MLNNSNCEYLYEIEKIEYLIDENKITEFLERTSKIMFGSGKDEQSKSIKENEHRAISERGAIN